MRKSILLIFIISAFSVCSGNIIYVDFNAPGTNNGTSWQSAYLELQSALSVAVSGDEIWVSAGTYKPTNEVGGSGSRYKTFQLKNGVSLYGGFVGLETSRGQRNWVGNVTILSGDIDGNDIASNGDAYHVFYHPADINLNNTAILDGFTIKGGNADGPALIHNRGGGMYNSKSSPTVTNCIFTKNSTGKNSGYGGGMCNIDNSNPIIASCTFNGNSAYCSGGMHNSQSNPIVTNCTFTGNSGGDGGGMANYGSNSLTIIGCRFIGNVGRYGGGIFNLSSTPRVTNCLFSGNSTTQYFGGGICNCDGSYTIITNCSFIGNSSYEGGGIYTIVGGASITNSVFRKNWAVFGGGICSGGNCYIDTINCTFSGNGDDSTNGRAMAFYPSGEEYPSSLYMVNCIIRDGDWLYNYDDSFINIKYSNVQDGWAGEGNVDVDPLFADADANDFHLKSEAGRWDANSQSWVKDSNTSPCIDAGDPNSDWKAELWPHGKRINMGAYGGMPQASMSLSKAGNIADLDNDGDLDFDDVKLFTEEWLKQQVLLAADLDRNGDVNFVDFAIFGNEWLKENAPLGMTYQIGGCDLSLSMVEKSEATRFTVTVNGHYIHFEDIMVANCCPEKLELEMDVYGGQISLYEREFLGDYWCICICNYPVTADLGPFEPGTYNLEVYEDYGGFIGSTTVIIE